MGCLRLLTGSSCRQAMPEIRNASHGRSVAVVFVDVLSWSLKRHFAPLLFKKFWN
jgi:hypothetical protein